MEKGEVDREKQLDTLGLTTSCTAFPINTSSLG